MNLPEFLTNPDPSIYLSNNFVVLDFEGTNLDKGSPYNPKNSIVLSVYSNGKQSSLIVGNELEQGELVEACEKADFLIAQNAKFELGWLRRCGLDISKVLVFDTLLADYVLSGNIKRPRTLDAIAGRYGLGQKDSYISKSIKGGICPSELPLQDLAKYCHQDVSLTYQVFRKQLDELQGLGLLPVMYTRCLLTPVLVDMESMGMHLDEQRTKEVYREYFNEFREVETELHTFTGGINTNSTKQLAEFLYDELGFDELKDRRGNPIRTDSGKRSTSSEVISRLKARNKRQREFVRLQKRHSELKAALSKNLEFFYGVATETEDSVFYANFNQAATGTHRLSSSGRKVKFKQFKKDKGVQFQNFPRKFKNLFSARNKGWLIGEVDGAQLEFRVATFLGQDEGADQDIRTGVDVHSFTSATLTEAGQPTDRQGAKEHTFKPLYGGTSGTKAEQAYYQAFKQRYPGIAGTQESWVDEVLRTKQLVTCTGLRFYWPDTRMTASGYITNTSSIYNYPVQSFATADIIPIAVVYMWHRMKYMRSFMVNTIHDSTISEIHPDEIDQYKDVAFTAFTSDVYFYLDKVYNIQFNVPLGAEAKISPHWSDGKEIKDGLGQEELYCPDPPWSINAARTR